MATVSTNLTNLKNARVAIINKLNEVQGTSIPTETTLAELPRYIEGGSMGVVDFDTWNAKSTTIARENFTYTSFPSIGNCYYKLITAEQDGYLSLAICIRIEDCPGARGEIRIKTKNSNNDLSTWAIASCSDGTDWYDNTGGVVALSLNTYISKGNTVAIIMNINWVPAWKFGVRNYGCTFYYK